MKLHVPALVALCALGPGCNRTRTQDGDAATAPTNAHADAAVPLAPGAGAPGSAPVIVMPGEGVGPIHLGVERAALTSLGLPIRSLTPDNRLVRAGVYTVGFDPAGRVRSVEVNLADCPGGVWVGNQPVTPGTAAQAIASSLPDCGPAAALEGGNVYHCANGTLTLKAGGPALASISLAVEQSP